jgi:hypothetical protein
MLDIHAQLRRSDPHAHATSRAARLATPPVNQQRLRQGPPLRPDRECASNVVDTAEIISCAGNGEAREDGLT